MVTPLNTFNFISETDRIMYETAFIAITQLELWDFMKNFSGESFMFSNQPEISQIHTKIKQVGYDGHSGGSFGFIMRIMQYIAINGIDQFQANYSSNSDNNDTNRS